MFKEVLWTIGSVVGISLGVIQGFGYVREKMTRLKVYTTVSKITVKTQTYSPSGFCETELPQTVTFKVVNKSEFDVVIEKISLYGTKGAKMDVIEEETMDRGVELIEKHKYKRIVCYLNGFTGFFVRFPASRPRGVIFTATNGSTKRIRGGELMDALNRYAASLNRKSDGQSSPTP